MTLEDAIYASATGAAKQKTTGFIAIFAWGGRYRVLTGLSDHRISRPVTRAEKQAEDWEPLRQ